MQPESALKPGGSAEEIITYHASVAEQEEEAIQRWDAEVTVRAPPQPKDIDLDDTDWGISARLAELSPTPTPVTPTPDSASHANAWMKANAKYVFPQAPAPVGHRPRRPTTPDDTE